MFILYYKILDGGSEEELGQLGRVEFINNCVFCSVVHSRHDE